MCHLPPAVLETAQAMLVSLLSSGWPFLVPERRHSRAIFTVGRGQAVCDERRLVCADRWLDRVRFRHD
jgi:hypothetical protein